ncbi:AsmA family protein [Halomonas sp. HP20-15]|uniref:AsmA family protein n=1 Tax=Halomonas sp. HP20-15 TaxID=3085901 RepID=UPI00298130C6|nr:AsmA family protein [Halomonas sp. HP20-15]MDW5377322.1 AsmA family protein [Halomonas sp. HP20-15]
MVKAARRLLVTLVCLLALLAGGMVLLESPWAREWLEGQVSQRLNGRDVEIGSLDIGWGWPLTVRLEEIGVANPDWAGHDRMLDLKTLEIAVDPGALLKGNLELQRLALGRPVIHLARREDGTSNWQGLTGQKGQQDGGLGISPDIVKIDDGHLTYRDPNLEADLSVDFHTRSAGDGARELMIEAQGRLQGLPLALSGHGGAPSKALAGDPANAYPVTLQGHLGQLQASFEGRLADVTQPANLEGQLDVSAPQTANLARLVGRPALELPSFELHGHLGHQDRQWSLQSATARLGESHVQGSVGVALGGARPRVTAQLQADRIDLSRWGLLGDDKTPQAGREDDDQSMPWDQRLAQQLAPLQEFDAQVDLTVDRLAYADTAVHDVALKGSLEAGRLDIQNLHLEQDRGALTAQGVLRIQPQTLGGNIDAQLSRFDLEEALAPLGSDVQGVLGGQLHARFSQGELALKNTSLDYRLPSQDLFLHVNADAADLEGISTTGVHLQGHGRYNGESFKYDLKVGPLLNLRDPDKPYPVKGWVSSDRSELHVDGTIEKPLELGRIKASVRLSGPNPARLNELTGLNLPALPPYQIQGALRVRGDLVRLLNLDGTFGNSDVGGDARLRLGERNMLWATLHSQRLDLDDLAPLTGSAPETGGGEAASPAQQAQARQEEGRQGLFSDREWDLQGLRRMDAKVRYSAGSVASEYVPLSDVSLDMTLERGVLTLDPLRMGVGGGIVVAHVRMDAHGQALDGDLDLSARQVNLKPILRRAGAPEIAEDSAGTLGGQGRVRFAGGLMDELMASLNGRLELALSGGRLDMLLVEALGLDVSEALMAALYDADKVPMRCAYTRLDADSGVAAVEQFFLSTADSNITGGGEIDLDHERFDLVFEAHPKDPSLPASDSPVRLQGTITNPQVDVVSRELIVRGVLSVLGALAAPPLAILPWVEPGLGEGAGPGCRQVLDAAHKAQESTGH